MSRQSDLDNHANQLNQNNDEYWHSRGMDGTDDDDDDWDILDDSENNVENASSSSADGPGSGLIRNAVRVAMPLAGAAVIGVAGAYFRWLKRA